jgi:hypothetical protein
LFERQPKVKEKYVPLYIRENDKAPFLACLGIGTLYAIREGVLPASAGIWTLGPPPLWKPLEGQPGAMADIVEVFSMADELSAIQKLLPDKFEATVDELIDRLKAVLASTGQLYWLAGWSLPPDDESSPMDAPN